MKKLLVCFLGLFVIASGIYTAFWWKKSNELQQHVKFVFQDLIADAKQEGITIRTDGKKEKFDFQYDSIEKRGFPFASDIVIVNPRLIYGSPSETLALKGNIYVKQSLASPHSLTFQLTGENFLQMMQKEEQIAEFNTKNTVKLVGDLSLNCLCDKINPSDFRLSEMTNEDKRQLLKNIFKEFSITANKFSVLDADLEKNNELLMIDDGSAYFHLNPKNELSTNDIGLEINLKNLKTFNRLSFKLNHLNPESSKELEAFAADYNTSNFTFKGHAILPSFNHPFFTTYDFAQLPPVSLSISQWDLASDNRWMSNSALGNFSANKDADQKVQMALKYDNQTKVKSFTKEELFQYLQIAFKELLAAQPVSEPIQTDFRRINDFISKHQKALIDLVPDLSSFGEMQSAIDLNAEGTQNQQTLRDYTVDLKKLEANSDLYKIKTTQYFQNISSQTKLNYTLAISNYQSLFHDMIKYYNRWISFLHSINIKQVENLPVIKPQVVDRWNQFLRQISDDPAATSDQLMITITQNASDPGHVGKLTLAEAVQALQQMAIDVAPMVMPAPVVPAPEVPNSNTEIE